METKFSITCVSKEHEVKIKMVREQWLQLKINFLLGELKMTFLLGDKMKIVV